MALAPGAAVVDRLFGPGTVVRETQTGYLISLERPSGIKVDRPRDTLTLPDGSPVSDARTVVTGTGPSRDVRAESKPQGAVPQTDDQMGYRARVAVDALRFGVVPSSHLGELTLGHGPLVAWVDQNLPGPGEPARAAAVYGAFGSGKSHTMAAIRATARQQGYLAMATEIDGAEISLAQPRELLASLLDHLTGSSDLDGAAPLLGLVLKALEHGTRPIQTNEASPLADMASTVRSLATTRRFDDLDDPLERLLGSDPSLTRTDFKAIVRDTLEWDDYVRMTYDVGYSPRPLISHTPVDQRPMDFIRALFGYASLAKSAGYQGLVVTIDELEVEDALFTAAKRPKLINFVSTMRSVLKVQQALPGGLAIFFAAVGEGQAVEDDVVSLIVDATPGEPFELEPWDRRDLVELSRRIHSLYATGYGVNHPYEESVAIGVFKVIDRLELEQSGEIRAFIRSYVARLDVMYGPPVGAVATGPGRPSERNG